MAIIIPAKTLISTKGRGTHRSIGSWTLVIIYEIIKVEVIIITLSINAP
jgi:hypothetical protein